MSNYHHGDLKQMLIVEGLSILNKDGQDSFSLRKVAKMCKVSHSAPYKHFKNKEELIEAISNHIKKEFANTLLNAKESKNKIEDKIIEVGVSYVLFMVENPEYYRFLLMNQLGCKLCVIDNRFEYDSDPVFKVFHETALEFFRFYKLPAENDFQNILTMWSIVQGLSTLYSGTLSADKNIGKIVKEILTNKIKFM